MARAEKALEKAVSKELEAINKTLYHFQAQRFACQKDMERTVSKLTKKWKYHRIADSKCVQHKRFNKRGRPSAAKTEEPDTFEFQMKCQVEQSTEAIQLARHQKGSFVIATNMPSENLPNADVVPAYKGQQYVERGYRFLKDPQFFTSAFYVKKPERLSALVMVMTLSLLVYSIAQNKLRAAMNDSHETLPDQLGKPTKRLTIRRAFQMLRGINIITYVAYGIKKTVPHGLTDLKEKVLKLIGGRCLSYYQLVTDYHVSI